MVQQDEYAYVRIQTQPSNMLDALLLERTFGGTYECRDGLYVWRAQDLETIKNASKALVNDQSLQRRIPHILTALWSYVTAPRGGPRTYAARTLDAHLNGGSLELAA